MLTFGVIALDSDLIIEEISKTIAKIINVNIIIAKIKLPNNVIHMDTFIQTYNNHAIDIAIRSLQEMSPDIWGIACTSLCFSLGKERLDNVFMRALDTNHPPIYINMMDSVLKALATIGRKNLIVLSPYNDETHACTLKQFEQYNIAISKNLNFASDEVTSAFSPCNIHIEVRGLVDLYHTLHDKASHDGVIFIACSAFNVINEITNMEKDIGMPIVTSLQAFFWDLVDYNNINEGINYGKLFET
uniref:Asp/Glu/Hydantoin racemase n=1 Tax=Megaviridae environmental sample TaxID=1737588 RepID=A0A5J6VJ33_9VIRU|nr:MAG: hypothetical protein [Megaviridae environmental sample]